MHDRKLTLPAQEAGLPDIHGRVFNDDLLLNRGDVELAQQVFPAIGVALNWPRLRETFAPHEQAANWAKRQSRRRGMQGLAAALTALWLAALEPRLHELHLGKAALWALAGLITGLGVLGVVLGSSVLIGERKERWLHHRAATERLRQLHFQILVRRATQLAATDPAVVAEAVAERERMLDLLSLDLKPGVTRPIEAIMEDLGGAECWLVTERPLVPWSTVQPTVLDELFRAYAKLRFQHQANYAIRKMAQGFGLWPWEPAGQARRIEQVSYSLTLLVIICHILAIVVVTFALAGENWFSPAMQTVGILAAMSVLALRVLEDGLRPRAEVGRLRTYRGEVVELSRKFEAAAEPTAKLALMERMEEVSYRELRDFLTLHDEASFVL